MSIDADPSVYSYTNIAPRVENGNAKGMKVPFNRLCKKCGKPLGRHYGASMRCKFSSSLGEPRETADPHIKLSEIIKQKIVLK